MSVVSIPSIHPQAGHSAQVWGNAHCPGASVDPLLSRHHHEDPGKRFRRPNCPGHLGGRGPHLLSEEAEPIEGTANVGIRIQAA